MTMEFYRRRRLLAALTAGLVLAETLAGGAQTLAEALNATNLVWTTGGDAPWPVQTTKTHDGVAAVQTPLLSSNQTSWIETTVVGPGTVRVWEMASYSDSPVTPLFTLNGGNPWGTPLPMESAWSESVFDLGEGTNVLRWTVYGRDQVNAADAFFLDEFVWDAPRPLALLYGPWDATVYAGTSLDLGAGAIGTPPMHFQWRRDGTNILNATNTALNWEAVTTNDAGLYSVVVSNSQGFVTSSDALLSVLPPAAPFFTAEPAGAVAYTGESLNLTATVDGSPAVYQWRKDGLNLPDRNWTWLQITNLSLADAGIYTLFVSNAWGSIESGGATVTVIESIAPTILRQPRSVEVAAGVYTWLPIAVSGTPDPSVVWSRTDVPRQLPPSYFFWPTWLLHDQSYRQVFESVSSNEAGVYAAEVSNSAGKIMGQEALLTVLPPISKVGENAQTAVAIFVTNGLAYLARGTNGFSILNVSNPASPIWLGGYQTTGYAAAIQVTDGLAFVADASAVDIFSVTNPAAPVLLGRHATSFQVLDLVVRSNMVYMANGDGGLAILDASNPTAPKLMGSFTTNLSPSHVCLAGNFAYLTGLPPTHFENFSNYLYWVGGMLIVDISNPHKPIEVGRNDSRVDNIAVRDQVAYVDGSVISITNPAEPAAILLSTLLTPVASYAALNSYHIANDHLYMFVSFLAVNGTVLGLSTGPSVLLVYDIREPGEPIRAGQFSFSGDEQALWVDGQYVYAASATMPLQILKTPFTVEPTAPPQLALTRPGGFKLQMQGRRGRHYAVEYAAGLTGLPWQTLQTVMLTNDTVTVPVSSAATARFFRLRQLD